jgi:KGK domain
MSQQAKLSLSTKDVIHIEGFQENASLFKNESTLRIRTILQQLQTACTASGMGLAEVNALMEQGIPCEVLQPGANDWQMGCIRLSLEFQPGPAASTVSMASTVTLEADLGVVPEVSLDSGLMDDLDDTFGEDLDMGSLDDNLDSDDLDSDDLDSDDLDSDDLDEMTLKGDELSGMMPDASESMDSDLDLSGLSDMDGFSDGLGEGIGSDDLAFDLDSQVVDAEDLGDLGDLTSPWDLSDDLDEMLLKNGSL